MEIFQAVICCDFSPLFRVFANSAGHPVSALAWRRSVG
jgi:hypothetical protein